MRYFILLLTFAFTNILYANSIWKQIFYIDNNHTADIIQAPDSNECLILMTDRRFCKIIASTNAGESWEVIYNESTDNPPWPDPPFPWAMQSPAKGWIYLAYESFPITWYPGIKGVIKRSKDRGKSFDTLYLDVTPSGGYIILRYLHMKDTLSGIVTTGGDQIFITKDGFDTYKKIIPDVGQEIFITDVYMHSYEEFAFLSSRGDYGPYYYFTSDAGANWNFQKLSQNKIYLENIIFINRNLGWIAASERNGIGDQAYDVLFKTTDGGEYWELAYRKENDPIFGLQDVAFCDEMNGTAVGKFGKVLRTTDGGNTWFQEYSDPYHDFSIPLMMRVGYIGSKPIIGTGHKGLWMLEETIGINEYNKEGDLLIYPNPIINSQVFNISFNLENNSNIKIALFNNLGIKVAEIYSGWKEAGEHTVQYTLDLELAAGTYWLRMTINNQETIVKPVVIIK